MKLTFSKGEVQNITETIEKFERIRDRIGGGDVETALGVATSAMRRALKEHYKAAGYPNATVGRFGTVKLS